MLMRVLNHAKCDATSPLTSNLPVPIPCSLSAINLLLRRQYPQVPCFVQHAFLLARAHDTAKSQMTTRLRTDRLCHARRLSITPVSRRTLAMPNSGDVAATDYR